MFRYTNTPAYRSRKLAKEYVRNGVEWLNENAPYGWQRNLFDTHLIGGRLVASARFKTAYSIEDVPSLAFEACPEFADPFSGRVSLAELTRRLGCFGLNPFKLGFIAGPRQGGVQVTCELLDEEWLKALTSYAQPSRAPRIQPREERSAA